MALIYHISCEACGDVSGAITPIMELQLDDGDLLPLTHPGESNELKAMGYTADQARREARLVCCEARICRHCGTIVETRNFLPPNTHSPMVRFVIGMMLLVFLLGLWADAIQSPTGILAIIVAMSCAVVLYTDMRMQRNWRSTVQMRPALKKSICKCGPNECHPIDLGHCDQSVPCPECGAKSVVVKCEGIS